MSDSKKQLAQGKLTYISLGVTAAAMIFQILGKSFPAEEANSLVRLAESAWPSLVEAAGLIAALYGRVRREWRSDK